jgi:hypothetical protein
MNTNMTAGVKISVNIDVNSGATQSQGRQTWLT